MLGPGHQLAALGALGIGMYLPSYLRNPAYPIFQDELFHIQTLQLMRDYGTTHIPLTNFPIAGAYPGLELAGLAIMGASGLPIDAVVRLLPIAFHIFIPVVAYIALRSCKLRPGVAFFGALVYMANWGYYWFHTTFSYESLGVLLFLLVATFAVRLTEPHAGARVATTIAVLLSGVAVVVTHHVSSLIAVALLAALTVAFAIVGGRRRSPLIDLTLFGLVVWIGWLVYAATGTIAYLGGNFADRITNLLALFHGSSNSTRDLFWNSSVPVPEKLVSYLFPVIVAALIGLGLYRQGLHIVRGWRAGRRLDISAARLALAVLGPLFWLATAPGVLTRTADVIYRSWSFVFLGVALFAAIGVAPWLQIGRRGAWLAQTLTYLTGACCWRGASSSRATRRAASDLRGPLVGWPGGLHRRPGERSHWLEGNTGRFHLVIGDSASAVAFAAWGMQRTNQGVWPIFYTTDPQFAQESTDAMRADFVAVDLRDSRYLPRYGFYFDSFEFLDLKGEVSTGQLLPLADLQKFDRMPALRRIYDNGDIVLYQNTGLR